MGIEIKDLRIGEKIIFGTHHTRQTPLTWIKVSPDTFISEFSTGNFVWDTVENRGFNTDYELSNVHQFLHSTEVNWFSPSHSADVCEYACKITPGFLSQFSEEEIEAIEELELPYSQNIASDIKTERYPYFRKHGIRARNMTVHEVFDTTLCRDVSYGRPVTIGKDANISYYNLRGGLRPVLKFKPGVSILVSETGIIVTGASVKLDIVSNEEFEAFLMS